MSYLQNRQSQVHINGTFSEKITINIFHFIYYIYIEHLESYFFCRFLNVTLQFSCLGHFPYCVNSIFLRGSHPSQIKSLGSIQVCHLIQGNTSSLFCLSMQHSFTHSLMAGRSMVVGHVLMDHMFLHVHQSHRHDSTYPGHFISWGALWEPLVC